SYGLGVSKRALACNGIVCRESRPEQCCSLRGVEHTFLHQLGAEFQSVDIVDCQDLDGRACVGSTPNKNSAVPYKMTPPTLTAWVEKRCQTACQRIDPGNVRPFVLVAVETTPRQIAEGRRAAMLGCDDMVQLKGQRIDCTW